MAGVLTDCSPEVARKVVSRFRKLDTNRDGMLSYEEMAALLKRGNQGLSEREIRGLFDTIDGNKTGRIDFTEFADFVFSLTPKATGIAGKVEQMKAIARRHDAEVHQVEIVGASFHPELNGIYEIGAELYNGRPTFDRARPPAVIFYGWTEGHERVGWFAARKPPRESKAVIRYKMFNPSPFADSAELCCATWENPSRQRDKRMVLAAIDHRQEFDESCTEGTCLPEELFGDAEEEALAEVEDLQEEADGWQQDEAAEGEEADWESEWMEQAGENVVDNEGEEGFAYEAEVEADVAGAQGPVEQFTDPDFPPDMASVGGTGFAVEGWRRLSEMHDQACLFKKIVPEDVLGEDQAANQWFLSACAAIAEYPAWVQSMFGRSTSLSPDGKYTVRLYHPGKKSFMKVTIDDYVPTKGGSPVFAGVSALGEIWVALVEKAFAKLCKTYKQTGWGSVAYGLLYLCGGGGAESWTRSRSGTWKRHYTQWRGKANDTIERRRAEGVVTDGIQIGPAMLWLLLRQYMELCYPVACTVNEAKVAECGLPDDCAYSLIGTREVYLQGGTLRMVRLRNSFGKAVWKGRWSDESEAWDECPAARNVLRFRVRHDGTFWMAYSDFLKYFEAIDCVKKSMPVQGCRAAKITGHKRGLAKFGIPEY